MVSVAMAAQPKLNKDNIDEVLKAMTLQEKATLLVGSGWGSMTAGSMTASDETLVPGAAGTTRAIPRLGIPKTVLSDGPAGLRISPIREGDSQTYYCTGFPVGTSLATTWNPALVQELTAAMGNEVKEYGADVLLAPGMNLHRNPLCGRNFEYFSEDPYLSGKIAAAYVNGIQSNGVGVSAKHFAVNSQETNRMNADSRLSTRALRELYLKGFEIMVKESSPWTIMSSYNRVNGPYTQEDPQLLTTILRDEWGFDGVVMTDWTGTRNTAAQVHAQNDLMEPGNDDQVEAIVKAVADGTLSIEDVDRSVRNVLNYIVKTPRFNGYKYSNKPDLKGHAALVRTAAAEGMVLLKNDGNVLPLEGVKNVALYGVASYEFIAGGTGSGNVNKAYVRSIAEGLATDGFTVDADIQKWYESYVDFSRRSLKNNPSDNAGGILLGEPALGEMEVSRTFIDSKVSSTDIAVLTISRNAGEGADRKAVDGDFLLTGGERKMLQDLADAYHAAGKKLVVVLNIGGVIETASWKHIPDAILLAWTPGQEGGYTVADVLCGKSYPSGKLPMTFPVSCLDIPSSQNFPYNYTKPVKSVFGSFGKKSEPVKDVDYVNYAEDIYVGYRYFTTFGKEVSYPFGFGLSYTSFEYSKPVVKVSADGKVTASVTVTNVGKAAGKESVQLYVSAPQGGLEKPAFELKSFAKTGELKPGQSQTLKMEIDAYALSSYNSASSQWETAAGTYTARFGASATDIRQTATFKLAKPQSWKTNDVMKPQHEIGSIVK